MILTDKFVYVHMPKTGGTFVAKVLQQIHEARGDSIRRVQADQLDAQPTLRRWRESLKQRVRGRGTFLYVMHKQASGEYNQHGICANIPAGHQHKPVLGTVRSPYDRYVSQYEFRWWALHPEREGRDMDSLLRAYPHFPELSFDEFVAMSNRFFNHRRVQNVPDDVQPGRHTAQIAGYYFRDPDAYSRMTADTLNADGFRAQMTPHITLLDTANLNQGLHAFLLKMGYAADEIAFILDQGKIMPKRGGRSEAQKWERYYSPETKAWVRQRERILFDLFPEFDV